MAAKSATHLLQDDVRADVWSICRVLKDKLPILKAKQRTGSSLSRRCTEVAFDWRMAVIMLWLEAVKKPRNDWSLASACLLLFTDETPLQKP